MERPEFKYDNLEAYTPLENIFGMSSVNDLIDNKEYMISLSEYHKRFYYLLDNGRNNDGAKSYNPPSWSNEDNIFSGDQLSRAGYPFNHVEWAAKLKDFNMDGDVLEFGVCSGGTIRDIANINPDKQVFGFEHFQGLEQTEKSFPDYSGWHKGAFKEPIPKEQVIENLNQFSNVTLIIKDIHDLEDPSAYGIKKICAAHIDVDIYEPTVSAFNFIDKCEWNKLYIRFDDWHGHEPDYDQHERLACKEWIDKNGYKFDLMFNGLSGEMMIYR